MSTPLSQISADTRSEIAQLYAGDTAISELLSTYAITPSTLYRLLDATGTPRRTRAATATVKHVTPARSLDVTVGPDSLVERVQPASPARKRLTSWEIAFEGVLVVDAESIDMALVATRALGVVRRITSARTK